MGFGNMSAAKADIPKDTTTQISISSKEFKGEGKSPDLATAKKIAIGNAKQNMGSKGIYKITDEKAYRTSDGEYKYIITIKVIN